MFKVRKHPFGYFRIKANFRKTMQSFICSEIKNVLRQITLSEDEILFLRVTTSVTGSLRSLCPVSRICFLIIRRFFRSSGLFCGLTDFPITGEFRSGLISFWHSCFLCLCPDPFRPDCSQVIAFPALLFPRTTRKLSERMPAVEVLSCSSHWLFSIRFYYISKIRFVNRKLECTLFLF